MMNCEGEQKEKLMAIFVLLNLTPLLSPNMCEDSALNENTFPEEDGTTKTNNNTVEES